MHCSDCVWVQHRRFDHHHAETPAVATDLAQDPQVLVRRVSTYANIANLAETYKSTVIRRYEGTALGQQELEGAILKVDDFGEALWMDTDFRVAEMPIAESDLGWHVIAVDPAVTSGGDETGIIVLLPRQSVTSPSARQSSPQTSRSPRADPRCGCSA